MEIEIPPANPAPEEDAVKRIAHALSLAIVFENIYLSFSHGIEFSCSQLHMIFMYALRSVRSEIILIR